MWSKDGSPVPTTYYSGDHSLEISAVKQRDNGTYVCNGTYPDGMTFEAYADVFIGCKSMQRKLIISGYLDLCYLCYECIIWDKYIWKI